MGKIKAATCIGCHKPIERHDPARYEEKREGPKKPRLVWHLACWQRK